MVDEKVETEKVGDEVEGVMDVEEGVEIDAENEGEELEEVEVPSHLLPPITVSHKILREVLDRQDMLPFLLRFQGPVDNIVAKTVTRIQEPVAQCQLV